MFRKRIVPFGLVLIGCTALMLVFLLRVENRDFREYEEILRTANPSAFIEGALPDIGRQQRKEIEKNIWFTEEGGRLHLRLESNSSELVFTSHGGKTELLEELHGLRCLMQEQLFYLTSNGQKATLQENGKVLVEGADPKLTSSWYDRDDPSLLPMQRVRYLEADRGVQNYTANLFTAYHVTLSRFVAPGHVLTPHLSSSDLLMKGIAKSVVFSLGGASINFKAHQMRATFYNEENSL